MDVSDHGLMSPPYNTCVCVHMCACVCGVLTCYIVCKVIHIAHSIEEHTTIHVITSSFET